MTQNELRWKYYCRGYRDAVACHSIPRPEEIPFQADYDAGWFAGRNESRDHFAAMRIKFGLPPENFVHIANGKAVGE